MIGLLAMATATMVTPGAVKTFGDWTVACDNVRRCQAVSLLPQDEFEGWASLVVVRGGERGAVATLTAAANDEALAPVTLSIDGGAPVARLVPPASGDDPRVLLDPALFTKLRNGTTAALQQRDGRIVARASLKGMVAAMRYIDDQQKRVGTVTALAATGPLPADRVPLPPPVPVVVRAPAVAAATPLPAKALLGRMLKASRCDEEGSGPEATAWRIDAKTVLVLLPCGSGAYNYASVPYLLRGTTFTAAAFDDAVVKGETNGLPTLINADYDPKTRTLESFNKGRGLGDCGQSTTHIWDGARFRLTEMRRMDECRGSTDWLRVWTAQAR